MTRTSPYSLRSSIRSSTSPRKIFAASGKSTPRLARLLRRLSSFHSTSIASVYTFCIYIKRRRSRTLLAVVPRHRMLRLEAHHEHLLPLEPFRIRLALLLAEVRLRHSFEPLVVRFFLERRATFQNH